MRKNEDGTVKHTSKDDDNYLQSLRWSAAPGVPEVPAEMLAKNPWSTLVSRAWHYDYGIVFLEARSVVSTIERFANCVEGENVRVLLLGDNLAVVLAFSRCMG